MMCHDFIFEQGCNNHYLKFSPKVVWFSLILVIVVSIFLVFNISFCQRVSFLITSDENNLYQVMAPYSKLDLWTSSNQLYYKDNKHNYQIKRIGENVSYIDNQVYLPLYIQIDNFNSKLPVLDISLENEQTTIIDYLKTKFKGE